ncbi:MAG: molybdopterin-guanine dinucleotide biosynthesis protein, partial [Nocardioidaceae bacterium]|nr:molybdopterin-guanine dinucleotide biosynthesis protein [Nocardioidaceae bacterium]
MTSCTICTTYAARSAITGFDAIVLAGGRGARMGGVDKSALTRDGVSLLARTCHALDAATSIVVVGHSTASDVLTRVRYALEDPPFGGPAAGIGAGLHALEESAEPLVVVVACDLPYVDRALPRVLATPIPAT